MKNAKIVAGWACGALLLGSASSAVFSRPLELAPTSGQASRQKAIRLVKAAEAAFYAGDRTKALNLCLQAKQVDAKYPRAYTWMGAIYEKQGQRDKARQAYNKVLALAPQGPDAGHVRSRLAALSRPARPVANRPAAPRIAATPTLPAPAPSVQAAPAPALPYVVPVPPAIVLIPDTPPAVQPEVSAASPGEQNEQPAPSPDVQIPVVETPAQSPAPNAPVVETPPAEAPQSDATTRPDEVAAEQLIVAGRLRVVATNRVQNRLFPGAFELSGADPDLVFQLNRAWDWFEVEVASPDQSRAKSAEIRGWLDDAPDRVAFAPLRVQRAKRPVKLRVWVHNATRLTLAPAYPGDPLVLINPRFMRDE